MSLTPGAIAELRGLSFIERDTRAFLTQGGKPFAEVTLISDAARLVNAIQALLGQMAPIGAPTFADHPPSVTELRGEKAQDFRQWKPRDVLISMLRDIDSGLNCDCIAIAYRHGPDKDLASTSLAIAGPNSATVLGTMMMAQHSFLQE
jgi:hypothetical protein